MHVHIINLEGKSIYIDAEPEDVVKTVKKLEFHMKVKYFCIMEEY